MFLYSWQSSCLLAQVWSPLDTPELERKQFLHVSDTLSNVGSKPRNELRPPQGFELHLQLAKLYLSNKKRQCEKSKFQLPELLKNVITVLLKDLELT